MKKIPAKMLIELLLFQKDQYLALKLLPRGRIAHLFLGYQPSMRDACHRLAEQGRG
jgi:hypothetical protein